MQWWDQGLSLQSVGKDRILVSGVAKGWIHFKKKKSNNQIEKNVLFTFFFFNSWEENISLDDIIVIFKCDSLRNFPTKILNFKLVKWLFGWKEFYKQDLLMSLQAKEIFEWS